MDQKNQKFFKRKSRQLENTDENLYIFELNTKGRNHKGKNWWFDYVIFSLLYTEIFTDERRWCWRFAKKKRKKEIEEKKRKQDWLAMSW